MKKVIILNASPRKNFNTAQVLEEGKEGAEQAGAEVEYIYLFDLDFKGCRSCYACKIKGSKTNGLCAIKDDLRPVLEKCLNSEAVIIGTPIYCGNPTGTYRNFMERFGFAAMTYLRDESNGIKRAIDRNIAIGIINTMGADEKQYNQSYLPQMVGMNEYLMKICFGYCETLNIFDTSHFADYSKYDCNMFDAEHKKQIKETQFPNDLRKAFDMGKRLAEMDIGNISKSSD